MSALPKTNTTVLPNYTLRQPSLLQLRMLEDRFAQDFLATSCRAAASLPPALRKETLESAQETVARGEFVRGMAGYNVRVVMGTYVPFMLWLCLSASDKTITQESVAALITPENEADVTMAVLEQMGYARPNDQAATGQTSPPPSQDPSPGTISSAPSATASSATPTSST